MSADRTPPIRGARGVRRLGGEPWLAVLVALTALIDAAASVLRYVHLQSGIDLAIFDQAVWHYSRLRAPVSSLKGENLLGDHFHPLVAVLAPLYWVWSDPRTLLIAQSLLVAASVVPVFLFARDRLGEAGAYLLAGAYAAFWGTQVGVLFDFHEVAFAPLLIACSVLLADRRRWGWFWLTIALLLGVKEDLSVFVVFFGIYLLSLRQIRRGLALVVIGAVWFELTTRVLIPHFAAGHAYTYWSYGELGKNPLDAIWAVVRAPWRLVTIGSSPVVKAHTLLALLAPFLLLSVFSRLAILAVPLLAERFLSTNPILWDMHLHYSMAIAPVLAMAAACGLVNVTRRLPARRRRAAIVLAAATILIANIALTRIESPDSALAVMSTWAGYSAPPAAGAGARAAAWVPASASVATAENLLAHVSERQAVYPIDFSSVTRDQYVVVNALRSGCCAATSTDSAIGQIVDGALPRLTPVYYRAGWLVARGPAGGRAAGNGVLSPMSAQSSRAVDRALFRWRISLLETIGPIDRCYRELRTHHARCVAGGLDRFTPRELALSAAIRTALPALTGGCGQLALGAIGASSSITRDLRRLTDAGATSSVSGAAGAYASFKAREASQDRTGLLYRFAILCALKRS